MTNPTKWYLLQTRSRDEQRAVDNLENQGVSVFCPTIEIEKIVRGKRQTIIEALFPGYVFVKLDDQSPSFTTVRSTRGVMKFVSFGIHPCEVPESLITFISDQLVKDNIVQTTLPKPGDAVEINDGPFKGLQAVFSQPDGNRRAIVLVTLMSQQVATSVENTHIQALK